MYNKEALSTLGIQETARR